MKELISQHAFIMGWGWDSSPTVKIPVPSNVRPGQDILFELKMALEKLVFLVQRSNSIKLTAAVQ